MKVLLDWEDETIAGASYNNCFEKEGDTISMRNPTHLLIPLH